MDRVCQISSAEQLLGVTNCSSAVLYTMSKKLAQILSLPLVLHNISSQRLRGLKQNDPKVHKSDNVPPEVALISTAIVVIKLVYGLDGHTRYGYPRWTSSADNHTVPSLPFHIGDPAYAFPKLDEWMALLKQLNEEDDRSIDNVFSSFTEMCGKPLFTVEFPVHHCTPRHVQELSNDELDEFLEFCAEKALANIDDGNGQ